MADSPSKYKGRVLACSVYCNSKRIPDRYQLTSASVHLALNRIGRAELRFNAGDMDAQTFDESDSDLFRPGGKIRFDAGDTNREKALFEGIVLGVRIAAGPGFRSQMIVECRDCAYPATQGRHNRIFEKKKDSEIICEVLSSYGSVEADATQVQHPSAVQYYATDWDFALSRADACGLFLLTQGTKIKALKPAVGASPVLTLTYGADLISFDGRLSCAGQFSHYDAVAWDPAGQKPIKGSAKVPTLNRQGDLKPAAIAVGESLLLQTDAQAGEAELKLWADSMALKAGLARYRGTMRFYGAAEVVPGCLVELKGLGRRFNGDAFIGSVHHEIGDNEWITEAEMGVDPLCITDEPDVVSTPASGLLPGIRGVHAGVVKQLQDDPAKEFRILVELAWMDGKKKELWARMASPYATGGAGIQFLPEKGDEVLVAFLNEDPRCPVVLASLYGAKHKPPQECKNENHLKTIVTRSKLMIGFDDEKKIVTLTTPGKNLIEINDEAKSICLTDQHKNRIVMNDKGISLDSGKDIVLKARGNIKLDAVSKVDVTAKSDVSLGGTNVKIEAKAAFTAKGTAKAEISASGQTVVKGAVVMIN